MVGEMPDSRSETGYEWENTKEMQPNSFHSPTDQLFLHLYVLQLWYMANWVYLQSQLGPYHVPRHAAESLPTLCDMYSISFPLFQRGACGVGLLGCIAKK